jgi:hypothetical protein
VLGCSSVPRSCLSLQRRRACWRRCGVCDPSPWLLASHASCCLCWCVPWSVCVGRSCLSGVFHRIRTRTVLLRKTGGERIVERQRLVDSSGRMLAADAANTAHTATHSVPICVPSSDVGCVGGGWCRPQSPANWRTVCYWRRLLPLVADYLRTKRRVQRYVAPPQPTPRGACLAVVGLSHRLSRLTCA